MRVTSLSGDWTLCRVDEDIPLHAVVPGVVQTDLISAGKLEDPMVTGDLTTAQELCEYKWRYSRSFILPSVGSGERVFLICEGLDTFADVLVNGIKVGKADNAFRTWKFDITNALKNGSNKLEIVFEPKKSDEFSRVTRTPSTGIWRGIFLKSVSTASFADVVVSQVHCEDAVEIHADLQIDTYGSKPDLTVKAELYYKGSIVSELETRIGTQTSAKIKLDVRNPQLWWPRTLGEQPLYELNFILSSGDIVLDTWNRRIGFKTISIKREKDDFGPNFQIYVNGMPIKIGGAGWTMSDVFPSRPTRVEYAKFVKSVRVANMDIIRVRGAGIYEHDQFYDLCDEHGILVWQDMMLEGKAYPLENRKWRENVLAEIKDNVTRVSSHACMTIFCGNDDLPKHFVSDTGEQDKISRAAYDEFFGTAVRGITDKYAPDIPYIESSVSADDTLQSYLEIPRKNKTVPFIPARFYSSFGVKSLSDANGNLDNETELLMQKHFRPLVDPKLKVPISQICQGLMIKAAVESIRRNPRINHGTVFSTLYDPVNPLTESSLERSGHWKCLHYFARRFFSNILISGVANVKQGTVEIFVHNDVPSVFRGSVKCRIIDTSGHIWREMEKSFEVPANTVKRLGILKLTDLLQKVGPDKVIVWIRMIDSGGYSPSSDCIRFVAPRALSLEEPGIICDVHKWDEQCYAVTLNSLRPAMWCWLELPICQARFDDNFICLAPGQPMRIRVTPVRHIKQEEFKKGLVVHSLYDTYEH